MNYVDMIELLQPTHTGISSDIFSCAFSVEIK
jgi:hypothetical protein